MILIETVEVGTLLIALIVLGVIMTGLIVIGCLDGDGDMVALPVAVDVFIVIMIILICADKQSYKIKIIDDNVTVKELTDTFIVEEYDAKNDIWTVQQKDGGLNPADLNKKGE